MKWATKRRPAVGDYRSRVVFAVFPHRTTAGVTVWLERVWVHETFQRRKDTTPGWTATQYEVLG